MSKRIRRSSKMPSRIIVLLIIEMKIFMQKIDCKLKMRWLMVFGGIFLCVACGPSEAQKKEYHEQKRVECLDKFCEGDIAPKLDNSRETALKINGQWYIGPREYFGYGNVAGFEWWERKMLSSSMKRPPEMQRLAEEGKGYDFSIEIFLRSNNFPITGVGRYQALVNAEKKGRLISKSSPRAGLEVWKVRDAIQGMPPAVWYVASQLKDNEGFPPVLGCDDQNPRFDRCTMAFTWQPGIAVDMRFRAKHGPDWPEIYQEMIRVLNLLKKA